ncbi:MAG: GatB/YqeY domain-containing protein [Gemmatimonadota bacterium]|nr:MAG: GatB/YqeY domain-containing protein [Gemmatimonadota bacterium]
MAEVTLKGKIRGDLNAARRQHEKDRSRLLSTVLADIRNREIELGHELADEEVVEVLGRCIKLRNEAAEQMASRPELAQRERNEVEALKGYMPPQLGEEEIRTIVLEAIEAGAGNIGALMGRIMPQLKGRADGKEVNRIARETLQARGAGG